MIWLLAEHLVVFMIFAPILRISMNPCPPAVFLIEKKYVGHHRWFYANVYKPLGFANHVEICVPFPYIVWKHLIVCKLAIPFMKFWSYWSIVRRFHDNVPQLFNQGNLRSFRNCLICELVISENVWSYLYVEVFNNVLMMHCTFTRLGFFQNETKSDNHGEQTFL